MKRYTAIFIALITLTAVPVFAQTGADIVDRHVQAVGGVEKLKSINTIMTTGTVSIPAMNLEMTYTRKQKRPNMLLVHSESPMGAVIQATNGETAWMINAFAGMLEPTEMPEEQAKQILRGANIDGFFVNQEEQGITLEYLGRKELGGVEHDVVEVGYPDGTTVSAYFDIETGILVYFEAEVEQMGQKILTTTSLSDYRPVDGMLVSHRMEQNAAGYDIIITVDDVQFNVPVDDSEFAMPEPKAEEEKEQ